MENKLRIQLFDEEGRMVSDRTVAQGPELSSGPKETHKGLFRIEFTLQTPDDIEKAKVYLDKLIGSVPLKTKKLKKLPAEEGPEMREAYINSIAEHEGDQDSLIAWLRNEGFVFRTTEFIEFVPVFEQLTIKDRHKHYQWMVREIKIAKNPKADKYDPFLLIGIILDGERTEKVPVYLHDEYHKTFKIPVPEEPKEVFKKTKMIRFPEFMEEDEKQRFMIELRALELDPNKNPGKFFIRWAKHIKNLPDKLKVKKEPN